MHHKRRKAKAQRAGCLMCKPHKLGNSDEKRREEARDIEEGSEEYEDEREDEFDTGDIWLTKDRDALIESMRSWRKLDENEDEEPDILL